VRITDAPYESKQSFCHQPV